LQWIDESSANLLFYLSKNIIDYRILILGAYRPEEVKTPRASKVHPMCEILPVMKLRENVSIINLGFLNREDVSTYISRTYPNHSFNQDFIDFVYTRTEGNSLFVVELIKLLEDEQIIAKEDTKLILNKENTENRVPEKVEDVIEHRINNIRDEIDQKIHEYASVMSTR
jgi:predicted ATPase